MKKRSPNDHATATTNQQPEIAVGKQARTETLVQQKRGRVAAPTPPTLSSERRDAAVAPRADESFVDSLLGPIQRKASPAVTDADVHARAIEGISGASHQLPHLERIQSSFGAHDVTGVQAHTDERAAAASASMGATAFATGDHVAFAGPADLHTAAHEAAHVVQQRSGVRLKSGVGQEGDAYEQHADAVADAVVRGESAEGLLDHADGGAAPAVSSIQHKKIEHGDDEPVTHGELKDMAERKRLIDWQNDSMNMWFHRMADGVNAACRSLAPMVQKKSDVLGNMIDLAAMAAIAGGAGVIASTAARQYARSLVGVTKEVRERFAQDSLKELMKKSLKVGGEARHDMTSDDIVSNFQMAQLNKIRHAQIDFQRDVGEGWGWDSWSNLPIEALRRTAEELSAAVKSDEVPHLAEKNTAIEWANLTARLHHGAGGWDPWAGEHGSERAKPTGQAVARPEGVVNPVDDVSNSNVAHDSSSMRDLVDLDQRKMNPSAQGILEVDVYGHDAFKLYTRNGFGMRLSGVSAHVKSLIADHDTVGDIKMNKIVTIYWDESMNPPQPYGRFLITADGYIRSQTMLGDAQLDAAAKFVQSLSPSAIK